MTADALAVSRESGAALVDTGGRFLVSDQMAARAKELGMQAGGLYFRGRTGALGEVSSHAATAILGIFPHWVIDLTWRESAALPAATAAPNGAPHTFPGFLAWTDWLTWRSVSPTLRTPPPFLSSPHGKPSPDPPPMARARRPYPT